MSTVVVGYVASAEGEAAVRQAIAEAKLRAAELVLVYSEHGSHDPTAAQGHQEHFQAAQALLADSGLTYEVKHRRDSHDPVHDVLQAAEDGNAELIVIGIRRRSPVGKLVLGSHSQSILLEASIPVLAVKA